MRLCSLLARLPRRWLRACAALAIVAAGASAAPPVQRAGEPSWRQFSDVVFRHFTPDTGLPFTGATAIAQDRRGFLWIGSQSGLARWDGQRFRVYQATDGHSGLRDNLIKVLHVDPRGRLWAGTNAGGMARYDPGADRFVAYGAGPHGLSHAGVRAIEDDGAGGLWVATSGGLDRVDPDARTVRRYRHRDGVADSLPADHVLALLRTRGGMWVGTRAGLSLLDPRTGRFRRVDLPGHAGAEQPAVTALTVDRGGSLWIGTVGAGAFRYDPKTGIAAAVLDRGSRGAALPRQTIRSIADDGMGRVWIATAGEGVVIVDAGTGALRRIRHDASVPSSLADDEPVALFRDRDGAIWAGTQRALSRYDPRRTGIWTLLGGSQRAGGLFNQDVTAVLAAADGHVWLGLGSDGVAILDPSHGTIARLSPRARAVLPPVPVSALAELADGRVIVGTNAGLFASDRTGARMTAFGFRGRERTREVTALLREGSTLWIGRLDGLWRLTLSGPAAASPVRMIESDRLADQRVMAIARGSDGALWIGTQNGLHRVVPGSGTAERVDLSGTGADGLVPTVLADARGRIWAGVYGHGIALIEQPSRRPWAIRHIEMAQGLPDANVDMLMTDGDGRIWASTDDGLAAIDPERMTIRTLQGADGVAISAYWSGSGMSTRAGQLLFGGLGGLTIVDPRQVAPPRGAAPLAATEIRVGGKRVAEAGGGDRGAPPALTIHPEADSVFVEFATLDYADAANARYRYRLRGYQDEWIDADAAQRSASYTNLPPGDYVLEVRQASTATAHADARGLAIAIRVLPAWYQTLWFRLALGMLVLGAIYTLVQLRTAVLRRRQHLLEELVADRTAALRASQRELEQIAYIDVLTGLPNRRKFNDAFKTCLERARRRGTSVALLLIDLDHFKAVNDTHGHDAGDALLAEVALRLQSAVGEYDILARLGGDEFAIVVADAADIPRVDEMCRRITQSLAAPIRFGATSLRSGASIGIALFTRHATTVAELYRAADVALYAAKKRGRGSWAWCGEELTEAKRSPGAA